MKTIRQIVNEKGSEIRALIDKYNDLENRMDKLNLPVQEDEWNELYMQRSSTKKSIARSIDEFATFLGFSINKDLPKSKIETYETIFDRLFNRWALSQSTLHQIYGLDKKLFTNTEYPFRQED